MTSVTSLAPVTPKDDGPAAEPKITRRRRSRESIVAVRGAHPAGISGRYTADRPATGVVILSLLALGEKRPLGTFASGAAPIPALDALLVATSGTGKPEQVAVHGGTAALTLALGAALLRDDD